jgi:hypothetical protein
MVMLQRHAKIWARNACRMSVASRTQGSTYKFWGRMTRCYKEIQEKQFPLPDYRWPSREKLATNSRQQRWFVIGQEMPHFWEAINSTTYKAVWKLPYGKQLQIQPRRPQNRNKHGTHRIPASYLHHKGHSFSFLLSFLLIASLLVVDY